MLKGMIEKKILNLAQDSRYILGIEGRCAAGKTSTAKELEDCFSATVIHMDDFFLPKELQTEEIAGNMDFDRLEKEVLIPMKQQKSVVYRAFHCKTQTFEEKCIDPIRHFVVIEGTYCAHPRIRKYFTDYLFMDIDSQTQQERILLRDGNDGWERFASIWIPKEERYFKELAIQEYCENKNR